MARVKRAAGSPGLPTKTFFRSAISRAVSGGSALPFGPVKLHGGSSLTVRRDARHTITAMLKRVVLVTTSSLPAARIS
jgi:hypothetical protein